MAGKGQTRHGSECDHREREGQPRRLGQAWGRRVAVRSEKASNAEDL